MAETVNTGTEDLLGELDSGVLTLTMNRPEARNAMDPESADNLTEAFKEFNASNAKVGVFYGAGGAFCAGWDLKYAQSLNDSSSDELHKLDFPLGSSEPPRGPLGPSRLELDKPVIGAIEGPAVAGGMELALWCDIRIMAEDAYLGVYCRRWGIPLLDGGHLLFNFVEFIKGSPIDKKTLELLHSIGFFVLISLMLFATYNDISRFFI